jgi:chromosome segregation ATPase
VWHLRGELETSQKAREELLQWEARAQLQIDALTAQVASLKEAMAVQETELTSAGAAHNEAEQGHQCLKAEYQSLRSACVGESSSAFIWLRGLVMNLLLF